MSPLELSNICWSLAQLMVVDRHLMAAIAASTVSRRRQFAPEALSTTAWAFAELVCWDKFLMEALAAGAVERVHELKSDELRMMLWAFTRQQDLPKVSWKLLEAAQAAGVEFSLNCFGPLLSECEECGDTAAERVLLEQLQALTQAEKLPLPLSSPVSCNGGSRIVT